MGLQVTGGAVSGDFYGPSDEKEALRRAGALGVVHRPRGQVTKITWAILLLVCTSFVGCSNSSSNQEAEREMQAEIDNTKAETARIQRETRQIRYDIIRMHFGEVTVMRYRLCTEYPPTEKVNQNACAKTIKNVDTELAKWEKSHKW